MTYYVYENWVAEKKARVHKGSCSHCIIFYKSINKKVNE